MRSLPMCALLAAVFHVAAADAAEPAWIWSAAASDGQTVHLRKVFDVPRGRLTGARLYVACDDRAEVFINGESVLEHRSREEIGFRDVSQNLERGRRNVVTATARNGRSRAGLLVRLVVEAGDGRQEIVSDDSWKVSDEPSQGWQRVRFNDEEWQAATVVAALGDAPYAAIDAAALTAAESLREPTATPVEQIQVKKGFAVELLYSVPKSEQGSWVNMCVDPEGRLIVSDQYGKLYRVTPPSIADDGELNIDPLDLDIGEAQGLLWAFDSLYVVVNRGGNYESGLYRATDSDGDGELDKVTRLRALEGGAEHGPHAVLLSPDGESLYIVCGNNTKLPSIDVSRVPTNWDEDILLPRLYGRGFMKGVPAPGGFIAKTDPDGKSWELIATGFRNEFDAAFNADGELFAYDADMEWDFNTPWYRPTRVCHVVSGAEFGWRNGSGKWPAHSPDSLPAAVDIGPGSPTGVSFGYGTNFPEQYQNALFLCDWSYGKLYAAHLEADGASYTGRFEEFLAGTPLPLTDIVVNPHDGAMYFTIGGRRVQSGLYRLTWTGEVETEPYAVGVDADAPAAREERRALEALHERREGAVEQVWPHLGDDDRHLAYAARVALEHQPVEQWRERVLEEQEPSTALAGILALLRAQIRPESLRNEDHDPVVPSYPFTGDLSAVDVELKARLLDRLGQFEWDDLDHTQRIALLRNYTVLLARMGPPADPQRAGLIARLDALFPTSSAQLNGPLCDLLVYLQAPSAAAQGVAQLEQAPTQEEEIEYAKALRFLRAGWNDDLRRRYFSWFGEASGYRGGANFAMFLGELRDDAVSMLTEDQKIALKPLMEPAETPDQPTIGTLREVVKQWTMDDILPLVETKLHDRHYAQGRQLFGEAKCFACHRFDNDGGAMGPDLTSLAGRFSRRDILESVLEPDKVISDQYAAVQIVTTGGDVVVGRIVNLNGDTFQVNTNMLDPNELTPVNRREIEEMMPSKVSMMPRGLLDTLHEDEILDLMAYLLSRGDRESELFAQVDAELVVPPQGFKALFNGVNLDGWHGMPHFDPRKLAEMSDEDRAAQIADWTADAEQHWSVENGQLVNDGFGAYMTTDESFRDYELLIDYRTVAQADSGIYLKNNPQVQIWDYTEEGGKWNLGADKGSGGLWNNTAGNPGKDPLVLADRPFGEWNSFRIVQVGARTSVWLNGYLVVDHAILENFWDRATPLFPSGQIQLQTHGGEIRWRKIFIREIGPDEAKQILREKSGESFTSLFNGEDLTGWKGAVENYEVVDGAIRCKDGHGGVLHTEEEYGDFHARLEFRLPAGGNNGLAIRYPGEGDPAYAGMCELQVLDTEDARYQGLDPRQAHGSAYGMVAAHRGFLRTPGQWNYQEVIVKGSTIKVELNGNVILDCDLSTVEEFLGDRPHPGKDRTSGYFGFAGHSDPVEFRKIEIKRLEGEQ